MTDEEIWKMLYEGGRDGSITYRHEPRSTTQFTASSITSSEIKRSINDAIHKFRLIEEKYDRPPELIVITKERFESISSSIIEENSKVGSPVPMNFCCVNSLYGIRVETFATQEECERFAKEKAIRGTRVMLIECE